MLFLHELGYNLFNIGKLTYSEIDLLLEAFTEREKRKEREYNKLKNKK